MTRFPRLLDSSFDEVTRLHPSNQAAKINLTSLTTASLTLFDGEPVVPVRSWIELYKNDDSIGIFRCVSAQNKYGNEQTLTLEHGITALGDELTDEGTAGAVIPITGTPLYILQTLLAYQVDEKWQVGTAPNTGSYTISVALSNVLSAVFDLCAKVDGYAYSYDFTTSPWTINMVALESAPSCEGRLDRNMYAVQITMDDNDLCTRVRSSKLSGGQMTADTSTVWGIVSKSLTIDAEATQAEATAYATAYLAEYKNPRISAEISAVDLSRITNEPLDSFVAGKLCRVALPDYGVTIEQRIVSLSYDDMLGAPESCKLTLSNIPRNITLTVAALNKKTFGTSGTRGGGGGASGKSDPEVLYTAIWQNKEDIQLRAWASDMTLAQAAIIVNANKISLKVSKSGVISSINQTAETITIKASRIELSGYVTASQLSSSLALLATSEITDLTVRSHLQCNGGASFAGSLGITGNLYYKGAKIGRSSAAFVTGLNVYKQTIHYDYNGNSYRTSVVTNVTADTGTINYLSH